MRKEKFVGEADIATKPIVTIRKKPGRKLKERPICPYPGCTKRVKVNAEHCSQTHARIGRKRDPESVARGIATKQRRRTAAPMTPLSIAPYEEDTPFVARASE